MSQLDRELSEYLETMVEGMGRSERRRAQELYLTGLLLDGERKSVEPMVARLVEDEAQTEAPPSRWGGEERDAPPGSSRGGQRGA